MQDAVIEVWKRDLLIHAHRKHDGSDERSHPVSEEEDWGTGTSIE